MAREGGTVQRAARCIAWAALAGSALISAGCARGIAGPEPAAGGAPAGARWSEPGGARATKAPTPADNAPAVASAGEAALEACGPFECRRFDSGGAALASLMAEGPLALGIGEAHALAGSEALPSTARRFANELLPSLAGRVSHLVVELLNPDPRCEAATREVRREQQAVTAAQSAQNQDDYVELGRRARALGVEPFVLSPSCDEFRAIAQAGAASIDLMLQTIARVTSRMLRVALVKNQEAGRAGLVIGYGGALHNDIDPSAAKAAWSYGPELSAFTQGRYVELDLIVREFIKDSEVWRALPWYEHFDAARFVDQWLLMRTGARRYVLFFPRSVQATPQPSPSSPTPSAPAAPR